MWPTGVREVTLADAALQCAQAMPKIAIAIKGDNAGDVTAVKMKHVDKSNQRIIYNFISGELCSV